MCYDEWVKTKDINGRSWRDLVEEYVTTVSTDGIPAHILANLVGKIVFWDFHGVLCPLQASTTRVIYPENVYVSFFICMKDPFEHRIPSTFLRNLIGTALDPEKQFVLSVVQSNLEFEAEKAYLNKYYPTIRNDHMFAVAKPEQKAMFISGLCYDPIAYHRISYDTTELHALTPIMVDDSVSVIESIEQNTSISAIHISSLMP